MITHSLTPGEPGEPSAADLAAIEREWPVIAAELDELDCVIRIISAAHDPTEIDVRHYRRAQRQVLRAMRDYLTGDAEPVVGAEVAGVA
jgi:hemoglobin-like flavoprotein